MYIQDIDLIKQQLHANSAITDSEVIKDIIQQDSISEFKTNMFYGKEYYKSKNIVINQRTFEYALSNGKSIVDEWRSNNKIPHGFLKEIVDQKLNYSLSKPVNINNADNIKEVLDINEFISEIGFESSLKGVGWLFLNYNSKGKLGYKIIKSEEIIPIYDTQYEDDLLQVIRYYSIQVLEGNQLKSRYKVELWDKEKVTYYVQNSDGNFILDSLIGINPTFHWSITTYELNEPVSIEGNSWGIVPFIPLWNNPDHLTDLNPIKPHIDMFDKINSDFSNNLEDLQDSVMKLVNYGGMTDRLDEFLEYLKKYKVLPLDSQGDAEYMTLDIPVEAKKTMLQSLRDSIFEFGQAVDLNKVGDGNITNIVIKSRYSGLDLKANDFEKSITKFLKSVFEFVNIYLANSGKQQDDIKKIEITFNRSIIVNNNEIVDIAVKSKGIISDKTIISNHPWVNNADDELLQIDEERSKNLELYGLTENSTASPSDLENDKKPNTKTKTSKQGDEEIE
jgi:SPP1 family phage portal protein